MSRNVGLMRAAYFGVGTFYVGGALAAKLVAFVFGLDQGDLFLIPYVGGPLLLGFLAGAWAYRHPPISAVADDDEAEPETARRRVRRLLRGPRSHHSTGP